MADELIGLPGVGKTTLLKNHSWSTNKKIVVCFASDRSFFNKFFNTIAGLIDAFRLFFTLIYLLAKYFPASLSLGAMRSIFIILERIGHARNQIGLVDEGVFQALWGLFFRLPLSQKEQFMIVCLVSKSCDDTCLYYMALNRKKHLERYLDRADREGMDFFDFCDGQTYDGARRKMSSLLRILKKNGITVRAVRLDETQNIILK